MKRLVGQECKSPIDETVGSVLLGAQNFVDLIKDRYVTGFKESRDVQAVRALMNKVSIQKISDIVDDTMGKEAKVARNIKIFLCQRYTGRKLKTIGDTFGIGDSAVSQV